MVLEGASGYDSTQDQGDAYAGDPQFDSNGEKQSWAINFDTLPKPWGVLSPIDWRSSPHRLALLNTQLNQAQTLLGRPLRQEEVDAVTHSFAKSIQWVSYTIPASVIGGAAMSYRGMDTFRIPFFSLKDRKWFNPDKFGPLTGRQARVAWHSLRFTTWGGAAMILVGGFLGSMANSTAMTSLISDPRLKDLKEKMAQRGGRVAPAQLPPSQRSSIETQTGQMDNQAMRAESMWRRTRNQQKPSQSSANDDDMSPTGGAGMSADTSLLSDSQMQMQEKRQQYEAAVAERTAEFRSQQGQQQQSQPQQQQRHPDQVGTASPNPPGSVWEKLRREAANRPTKTSTQEGQRSRSSAGDDFTFSHKDEDRQLAQNEAQRDFDARVERERHGADFNSNSRGRW